VPLRVVKSVKPFKGEFELAQMVKFELKRNNCTMYMTMTDNNYEDNDNNMKIRWSMGSSSFQASSSTP
jgi:hypothetical protein